MPSLESIPKFAFPKDLRNLPETSRLLHPRFDSAHLDKRQSRSKRRWQHANGSVTRFLSPTQPIHRTRV